MINQKLLFARAYEKEAGAEISADARPVFHMTPQIGWTNDPNGFSYYKGQYHLFYQSNPYDTVWNAMHWGHVVSTDLLHWQYLPCAMAPDEPYDSFGVFSGTAVELPDGKQLLMYTGVRKEGGDLREEVQTQCVAIGDGLDYHKYEGNPVIDVTKLPEGLSRNDFRDPKIWRDSDGTYRCVVGTCRENRSGVIVQYCSKDALHWEFESILIENNERFGLMWECPDYFVMDGKQVLLCSPQDMLPEGFEFRNGNGTLCLIGHTDEGKKHFTYEHSQAIDNGIDFYAPQTLMAPDGRRIMIAWMQNWDSCDQQGAKERKWFGQMTLPRELTIENGRLYQRPIRELLQHRSNKVEYKNVLLDGQMTLEGIEGRTVDMEITIRPKDKEKSFQKFALWFAQNEKFRTSLSFKPYEGTLKIDRKFSGSRRAFVHQRRAQVKTNDGELKLRVILDRFSAEVFINDGEQTMTATIMTDLAAQGISFCTDGQVEMDIVKYDLFKG